MEGRKRGACTQHDFYFSHKEKHIKFAVKWMDLKSIMLSQVTESERQILHILSQTQILDFSFGRYGWM